MRFSLTSIAGAFVVDIDPYRDDRGFFARTWCAEEAVRRGLCPEFSQTSISFNAVKGTLRGLHFQRQPHAEDKLVRCTSGAIFDVAVDLRPDSSSFRRWFGIELSTVNHRALYIPQGCAHGFQTLTDRAEVLYQISTGHRPEESSGVRWDDPMFRIEWPEPPRVISERDRHWSDFAP